MSLVSLEDKGLDVKGFDVLPWEVTRARVHAVYRYILLVPIPLDLLPLGAGGFITKYF